MKNLSKTRYFYLYNQDEQFRWHPHTCIAARIDRTDGTIYYALSPRDSARRLTALRRRMAKIQELGGVVPGELVKEEHAYRRNHSKANARQIAATKLDEFPRVIENVEFSEMNTHDITRLILEDIVDSNRKASLPVKVSAQMWLQDYAHMRTTLTEVAPNVVVRVARKAIDFILQ